MVWTESDCTITAHGTLQGGPPLPRDKNIALVKLTKDEALGLIQEVSRAFGIDGVPSHSADDEIYLIIENADRFYPRQEEAAQA